MNATPDLFATLTPLAPWTERLASGTALLHGFALNDAERIWHAVQAMTAVAPFRNMVTPGGFTMSVAITNCGDFGWVSDLQGYRYAAQDPLSGQKWPPIPAFLKTLAQAAAAEAGYPGFEPDACLVNRYLPGARMSLHQDKNERDFRAPIVSISLGLPATFQLGGLQRSDRPQKVPLVHGDMLVWGGPDRLRYHGVMPLKAGEHPLIGAQRINLTLRKAG